MTLPDDIEKLGSAVRNWGRWGDRDQLGTLNLIDDAARRRGLASVRTARPFSLAIPWSERGPQVGLIPGRINPLHTMLQINAPVFDPEGVCFNDDVVVMGLQAATHWDGLAHVSYRGRLYNGYPADLVTAAGAGCLGIHHVGSLVTRGILLDVARVHGLPRLPAGHAITADDLDAACEMAGTKPEPGDAVLIRTGHITLLHEPNADRMAYATSAPGPSLQSVRWFRDHDIAALAIDNLILEVLPGEREDAFLPVHYLHLVEMGLTQGQNWDLEVLAADCADDRQYTFLLVAPPEPVMRGTGAPVHPVALK